MKEPFISLDNDFVAYCLVYDDIDCMILFSMWYNVPLKRFSNAPGRLLGRRYRYLLERNFK
jgi:hypothetical protein